MSPPVPYRNGLPPAFPRPVSDVSGGTDSSSITIEELDGGKVKDGSVGGSAGERKGGGDASLDGEVEDVEAGGDGAPSSPRSGDFSSGGDTEGSRMLLGDSGGPREAANVSTSSEVMSRREARTPTTRLRR